MAHFALVLYLALAFLAGVVFGAKLKAAAVKRAEEFSAFLKTELKRAETDLENLKSKVAARASSVVKDATKDIPK